MRPPLLHNPSMYRTTSTYRDQPSALPSSICHFSTAYSAQSRRIKPGKSTNVTSIISLLNMLSASYSRVNSSSFLHRAIHFHHCLFARRIVDQFEACRTSRSYSVFHATQCEVGCLGHIESQ
eukprot:890316_1